MPSPGVTKGIIADAMKQLMEQKPLAKISVGDIVEACDLNRNSFYYHFKDKYDLVNWIFYTELVQEVSKDLAMEATSWDLFAHLCSYLYRNRSFYLNALSVEGQNSFSEYFQEMLADLIKARSDEMFLADKHQDFYIAFVVDAFSAAVFRWLRGGAKLPPEELAEVMKKAATGAATRILKEMEEEPQ